ncbi:MAG: signal peptidase II [Planctomycetota bacterium]
MSSAAASGGSAARSPAALLFLLVTIVLGTASDLWSKHAAFAHVADQPVAVEREAVLATKPLQSLIPPHEPVTAIPSVLEFTLVLNPGAVFGLGAGQRWIFIAFTAIALVVGWLLFAKWTRPKDHIAHVSIGLLVAGGLGNLYDRLVHGCVRDFIHPLPGVDLPFGVTWPNGASEVWPWVSNVADLWLLIGIGVLLVLSWRTPDKPAETQETTNDTAADGSDEAPADRDASS